LTVAGSESLYLLMLLMGGAVTAIQVERSNRKPHRTHRVFATPTLT
jgi:hypothetical protein